MKKKKKKPVEPDVTLLTSLNLNPRNPRTITPKRLDMLAQSLKEFGDLSGIVLNTMTGRFVGGHQRFVASGRAELPATIIERLPEPDVLGTVAYGFVEIDGTKYSYREVAWTEDREMAANIAANAHGGEFDDAALTGILKEMQSNGHLDAGNGISGDLIGLDDARLAALLADGSPPPPTEPKVKRGPASYTCPNCGHTFGKVKK
jgi:hypothetical protein